MPDYSARPAAGPGGARGARGARGGTTATLLLLGTPDMPFVARHNLTVISSAGIMNILGLAILFNIIWRLLPVLEMHTGIFIGIQGIACTADLAWRRCSLARSPACGGSYLRWREVPVAIVLRLLGYGIGMRGYLTLNYLLKTLEYSKFSGGGAAALLFAISTVPIQAWRWAGWRVRIFWAIPVEVVSVAHASWCYRDLCGMQALTQPGVQRVSGAAYDALAYLQSVLVPLAGPSGLPTEQEKCGILLLWLRMGLGLAVPALLQAAYESRLFATHQQQRLQCGLQPERGWQARAYSTLAACLHPDHTPWLPLLSCVMLLLLTWETAVVLHLWRRGQPV